MLKYTIEGNINFKDELYKLLDIDSDDEEKLCQITGAKLTDKHVILECNHHFNYDSLYKEIYNQKYKFKTYNTATYDTETLTQTNKQKFIDSGLDYYIKCPYCRNIQFTILPYYEELGLKQIYGINSLDKTLPNSIVESNSSIPFDSNNHAYKLYGKIFKKGHCCEKINSFGDECPYKFVTLISETQLYYCKNHYKQAIISLKMSKKKKIVDAKLAIKKESEDKLLEKKKLLEEQNAERVKNGLLPLKRIRIKVENIVENQSHVIQNYISEEEVDGCKLS
jgi:hypothetical protein